MQRTKWRKIFSIARKTYLPLAVACILFGNSARGQCPAWKVAGSWSVQQGSTVVNFDITQKGNIIAGKANYTIPARETKFLGVTTVGGDTSIHYGDVDGTVIGDNYTVHVYWDTHNVGVYTGTISPGGRIEGTAYDKAHPATTVQWYSKINMACPATPVIAKTYTTTGHPRVAPPPPPVKTIKATGHPRIAAEADDNAAATVPTKVPGIAASLNNATIPAGKSSGKTTITWDGGRAHPYAEVWLKVDDEDETKVIEAGKGSLQETILPGKTYLYILTDAGKTLATVTVRFHR